MSHPVVRALGSSDPQERIAACNACATDPSSLLLIDELARVLGDSDKRVVRAASDALVTLAGQHETVRAVLREGLRCDDSRTRWGAAYTSARIWPPQPGLLPTLVEAMASKDGDVRWAAARVVVDMARLHDEAFRVVLQLVEGGESPQLRRMAVFCLRDLAPDDPAAARVLLDATRASDLHQRRAALTALGALLDPPAEVATRLVEAINGDADPASRRVAALALGQIGAACPGALPNSAVLELKRVKTETNDPDLERAAALALAKLEPGW